MTSNQVINQIQALHQLVMQNYSRTQWVVKQGMEDQRARTKLDIFLQPVFELAERTPHVKRWSVPSKSNGDYYDVIQLDDGSLMCECKSYKYRRECSHINEILDTELDERQTSLFPVSESQLPEKYMFNRVLTAIFPLLQFQNGHLVPLALYKVEDLLVSELYALLTWLENNGGATAALKEIRKNPQGWGEELRRVAGNIERGHIPAPPPVDDEEPVFEPEYSGIPA